MYPISRTMKASWKILFTLTALLAVLAAGLPSQGAQAASISPAPCDPAPCQVIKLARPAWFEPQLLVTAATPLQAGPGAGFSLIGELPSGAASRAVGVSQDGNWLAISLSPDTTSGGIGWVNRSAVATYNIEAAPEWLRHCGPGTYCSYILSLNPQYLPVRK